MCARIWQHFNGYSCVNMSMATIDLLLLYWLSVSDSQLSCVATQTHFTKNVALKWGSCCKMRNKHLI
jgi:hypothetical protein